MRALARYGFRVVRPCAVDGEVCVEFRIKNLHMHMAGPGVGPGVGPGSGLTSPGGRGPGVDPLIAPGGAAHSAHSRAHAHRFLLPQSGVFIGIETVIEIDIDRPFAPSFFARHRESPTQPT